MSDDKIFYVVTNKEGGIIHSYQSTTSGFFKTLSQAKRFHSLRSGKQCGYTIKKVILQIEEEIAY